MPRSVKIEIFKKTQRRWTYVLKVAGLKPCHLPVIFYKNTSLSFNFYFLRNIPNKIFTKHPKSWMLYNLVSRAFPLHISRRGNLWIRGCILRLKPKKLVNSLEIHGWGHLVLLCLVFLLVQWFRNNVVLGPARKGIWRLTSTRVITLRINFCVLKNSRNFLDLSSRITTRPWNNQFQRFSVN